MTLFELPKPNLVDAVSIGLILLAMLQGIIRGLARELGRLIAVLISLALGLLFYTPAALFLQTHSSLLATKSAAFAFIALISVSSAGLFVGRFMIGKVVTMNLDIKGNKPGGLFAGFLSSAGLVYAVFFAINLWPGEALHKRFFADSLLGAGLVHIMPGVPDFAAPQDETRRMSQEDSILDEPPPAAHPSPHK